MKLTAMINAIRIALRHRFRRRKRRNLLDLYGKGGIRADYDYKKMRAGDPD